MEQAELIEFAIHSLPYPEHLSTIDITSEREAVSFNWRGARYRVDADLHVKEVGDGVLIGSDKAILMGHLLQKTRIIKEI